jgi:lantibiotic modifying enzyme
MENINVSNREMHVTEKDSADHLNERDTSLKRVDVENKLLEIIAVVKANSSIDSSLFIGHSGFAIFWAYVNELYNDPSLTNEMEKSIAIGLEMFRRENATHTFCNGFAGVCWATEHIVSKGWIEADISSLFEDIEPYLAITSENDFDAYLFDFMHGGIGAGIYFLERSAHPTAQKHLVKIVDYLEQQKITSGDDIFWMNNFMKSESQKLNQEYNLGLAHGIPSVLYFLTKCYEKDIEKAKCQSFLEGAIGWLIKQKLTMKSLSIYPATTSGNQTPSNPSRLAWCYGDLGIASTIWLAGKTLNKDGWKKEGLEIMLYACERKDLKANNVMDAGICHGAAGVAHFFNRFYWETKMPIFKETASYWIHETLKMATFNDGLAGYKAWQGEAKSWLNEYGLLEGISGIGLVLYSYLSDEEPTWDKCLLLS